MKKLFAIAFKNQKHRILLALTMLAMVFSIFTSYLEIFAIGIITKKGPDFFELVAPASQEVTKAQLDARWNELDPTQKGTITKAEVNSFLANQKEASLIDRIMQHMGTYFPIGESIPALAVMLIVVAIIKSVAVFAQRFTTRLVSIRVSQDLRLNYFEHIQSLPMSFFQKYHIGSLSSRAAGDATQIADSISACLVNYLQTPVTVLASLVLCFLTSWKLSLIIFFGFPLIIFPIVFLTKRVKRVSKQLQQNQERFASVLIDFLAGVQTVKVFAMEDFSLKKYREMNQKMATLEQKRAKYDLLTSPIVHVIGMGFLTTALLYGLYVLNMNITEVFLYCGMLYFFYMPIKKFAEENAQIQRGVVAAERMLEILDIKPQISDEEGAHHLSEFNDKIEFEDVWFRYGDQWILEGLNFSVRKGETVAIVGPTGAGKSTIAQLLPRLYDVEKGDIRIDGKSIKTFTQRSLRDQIAFVPQKPFLFLDTISENICYGRKYSPEQIQEAARKAHAEEFICRLPKGYSTELSETGKNLSGGQQQRLAIARALVKNAPILVMDEATSSLDSVSESHIKNAIHQLRGQVTQIIIAHRLSTIEDADKIIYIEDGKKIAEGTREELLLSCPPFRKMWDTMQVS